MALRLIDHDQPAQRIKRRHGLGLAPDDGYCQLASFRYMVSDHLHIHILSTMLGRHHALADNNYGRLSSFIAAWNTTWDGRQVGHDLPMAAVTVRREISPLTISPGRNRGLFVIG
jgi:exopolysaccharide biosynthesis predicted pyruvyltransferase EpsI